MSQKRDWPRSAVLVLAAVLIISLGVESWLLFSAQPAFVDFTGRQSGTVSLVLETDLPALTAVKNDTPDPVNTSKLLTYNIAITNTGASIAYNVTLNETYPSEVTFVSGSPTPLAGNTSFLLGNLSPSAIYVVNITVNVSSTVGNATVINNTVNLTFFSTLNTIHSSLVTANTTVSNGSVGVTPEPGGGVPGGGEGGGGGGGGCVSVCTPGTSICSPDGRKTCLVSGGCAYYALAPCAVGSTCSAGACLPCTESWICGDWSKCSSEGIETRECFDVVGCGTTKLLPAIERACIPYVIELPDLLNEIPYFALLPFGPAWNLLRNLPTPLLAFLLGLGVLFIVLLPFGLDRHLEKLVLYMRLAHLQTLIASKQYALAHEYADKIIKPYLTGVRLDPRTKFDRKLFRMYHGCHRDLAHAYETLARQAGDKTKEQYWKKRAKEYAEEVMKYN